MYLCTSDAKIIYQFRKTNNQLSFPRDARLVLPDFICAKRAKHSAAVDFASSLGEHRRTSIKIPHPVAVFTEASRSRIKLASTTI